MADREDTIAAMLDIGAFFETRADTLTSNGESLLLSWAKAARDAARLLEVEAIEPERMTVMDFGSMESELCLCGACHKPIGNSDKYCKHCGKKVKWECD